MKCDAYTTFVLLGCFMGGATVQTMLALVMNPIIGGVLVVAIAVPLSTKLFD